jgi:hypothetical protein
MISNYKSAILNVGKPKKRGRKPGRPVGAHPVVRKSTAGSISLEDIKAVKALADKIGLEKLVQLADVLA